MPAADAAPSCATFFGALALLLAMIGIYGVLIFEMMVLMALVTTAMTGPFLSLSLNWWRSRTLAPCSAYDTARLPIFLEAT